MKRAVVVFSGGVDSTTLLFHVMSLADEVYAISFDYGQRHSVELEFAARMCKTYNIAHEIVKLDITRLVSGSSLTSSEPVPEGHYTAENMKSTVVPNRNAIMLAIAYGWAVNLGADAIFTGVHAGDHAIYADCRPEFIGLIGEAFGVGNAQADVIPKVFAPFVDFTKEDIVRLGDSINVPWAETWSCYQGSVNDGKHCGRCGTCVERREAFHLAGVVDPIEYVDPDFWSTATKGESK